MGAAADIITDPYRPMIAGWCIGVVSALGFLFLSGFLKNKIGLHDSCGVLNLHGIPGILGSVVVAISTSKNAIDNFGDNYEDLYTDGTRTANTQSGYQMAGIGVTLGISIVSGLFAGFIASRSYFQEPDKLFTDDVNFSDVEFPAANFKGGEHDHEKKPIVDNKI